MDHIAAAEERIVTERLRNKLNEVNSAAQTQLGPITDHVNFTLQQAYYKCAYECFDRTKKYDDIGRCVENCSLPVSTAQHLVEGEMAKFQERLNRSMMVCQDKFETAKHQKIRADTINDLESCVDQSIQDSINELPHLVQRLKTSLFVNE